MNLRQAFFRDLPWEQQAFDYGGRTDGQPVYMGHAALSASASDKWVLFFFKYNVAGFVSAIYSLEGAWDNRVALFLDYI